MRFRVERASGPRYSEEPPYDELPPCEGAFVAPYVRCDRRTADDPAKIPAGNGESAWWYAEGRDHRVVNGQICRDFDAEDWFIEIGTLDELMALVGRESDLIVGLDAGGNPVATIHDSYVE